MTRTRGKANAKLKDISIRILRMRGPERLRREEGEENEEEDDKEEELDKEIGEEQKQQQEEEKTETYDI